MNELIAVKEKILMPLKESISDSARLRSLILENNQTKVKRVIRLNLVYLTYDFLSKTVMLEYYAEDEEYPSIEMSFRELADFLKNSIGHQNRK